MFAAHVATVPLTLFSTIIADQVRDTGYLLIVAFDVVLAAVVAPLFGAYYTKNPSPRAAFVSVCSGAIVRIVLEFTLPKDGYLVLPYKEPEFVDYGPAASSLFPVFFDQPPELLWNATAEPCDQPQLEDYTGVDSLAAFLVSILTFVGVQAIENATGKPLFNFPGLTPYEKETGGKSPSQEDDTKHTKKEGSDKEEEAEA